MAAETAIRKTGAQVLLVKEDTNIPAKAVGGNTGNDLRQVAEEKAEADHRAGDQEYKSPK